MSGTLRQAAALLATLLLIPAASPVFACSGRVHIEVKEAGVYALDYAAIVAAQPGLADCRAADLALLNRDQEVPIRVVAGNRGDFAPGARIEWLGRMLHGPQSWFDQYSGVNVYQLAATPGPHARLRELDPPSAAATAALRRRLHFEQENLLIRLNGDEMKPGDEPDVWQWAKLTPIDPQPFAFDFDLPDVEAGRKEPIELTLDFRGESNVPPQGRGTKPADHVVEFSLNGRLVQTFNWDGRAEHVRTLAIAPALLKAAHNTLNLRVPRRDLADGNFIVDVVMFNWMEVAYPAGGNLDAGAAPFHATSAGAIGLRSAAATAPALFGSDGTYRRAIADPRGGFRAAPAGSGVELYPVPATGPMQPALVRAVADARLRNAGSGYDYLIVAHPRLIDAIQPLARYHRGHGLSVAVIDVDAIYDEFGGGIVHPRAIRDFVAYAMEHSPVKPRYLLLVGDASFDIHHDLRTSRPTPQLYAPGAQLAREYMLSPGVFVVMPTVSYADWSPDLPNRDLIPTWQMPSSNGQFASDNPFVALTDGDMHPQLAVGRLPVVEPEEVKAIVDKTISYLTRPAPGDWRRDVTFVSTSEIESLKQESDRMAADLQGRGFAAESLYSDAREKDSKRYLQARRALKENLDAGGLLVHFLGHGGQYIWRVGPIGDLFSLDDVSALRNAGRYPMVLAMTCFSAPFDHPSSDSIGERFLREADKGAIAVFAASWTNWPNPAYSKTLIDNLLKPETPIGDAIVTTKAKIDDPIFVEMYNLLGDPAVVLAKPPAVLRFARSNDRWDPRIVVRVPAGDFGGDVSVDWIGAADNLLAAQRFQARNAQFMLTPPPGAVRAGVYTRDGRDGTTAMGGFDLREPVAPVAAKKAQPPVPAPTRRTPPASEVHDRIRADDFEESS